MAVRIILGALISICSECPGEPRQMPLPSLGMLIEYYAVAALSHGVCDKSFIIGWTILPCAHLFWHAL